MSSPPSRFALRWPRTFRRVRFLAHAVPPAVWALALCILFTSTLVAQARLDLVRKRGALVCGVTPGVRGFADVDDRGRYSGTRRRRLPRARRGDLRHGRQGPFRCGGNRRCVPEVDRGRSRLATADVVAPARRPRTPLRPGDFLRRPGIHGAARAHDQDAARARRRAHLHRARDRDRLQPEHLLPVARPRVHGRCLLRSHDQVEGEFAAGRCDALTADLSELGSVRSRMTKRDAFEILPELISKEPIGADRPPGRRSVLQRPQVDRVRADCRRGARHHVGERGARSREAPIST